MVHNIEVGELWRELVVRGHGLATLHHELDLPRVGLEHVVADFQTHPLDHHVNQVFQFVIEAAFGLLANRCGRYISSCCFRERYKQPNHRETGWLKMKNSLIEVEDKLMTLGRGNESLFSSVSPSNSLIPASDP